MPDGKNTFMNEDFNDIDSDKLTAPPGGPGDQHIEKIPTKVKTTNLLRKKAAI